MWILCQDRSYRIATQQCKEMQTVTSSTQISKNKLLTTGEKGLLSLSSGELLKRILESENPGEVVRKMPAEDLFWIVKRIGEEESLTLLELASEDQWQYLVDLDAWSKDTLSPEKALDWIKLLAEADPARLSAWALNEEKDFLSLILFRTAQVIIKDEDDVTDLPGDWFTLDGRFYVKALNEEDQEALERLLSTLGKNDHDLYQRLLFTLAAVIPSETEEELYHFRNTRIAEHGFLPFEEAIAVYAPLDAGLLETEKPPLLPGRLVAGEEDTSIPALPLAQVESGDIFSQAFSRLEEASVRDRVSLEFAALVNQLIVAADLPEISDPDILVYSCRQAAGYLNVTLERLCGRDMDRAENLLRNHTLLSLFRTGYGFAVALKLKTRKWRAESWFFKRGLKNAFWGTPWGDALDGLLMERPRYFSGPMNAEPFKEFANVQELDNAEKQLRMIQSLDRLLARLSPADMDAHIRPSKENTVHSMIFTRWAHKILGEEPSFAPLSRADAARFFHTVRDKEQHIPYRMASYREVFIADFMEGAPDFEPEASAALTSALEMIWEDFTGEYENIAAKDLEGRYSPFLRISP